MLSFLLISYSYPPSIGGVERQSHLLARSLVARGHRVRVVAARPEGSAARELLDGVEVTRVRAGSGGRLRRMTTFLWGLAVAVSRLGRDADVIQVQQILYPAAVVALLGRALSRPVVARNTGSGRFGGVQLMRTLPLGTVALGVVARLTTAIALNDEMAAEMRGAGFRWVVQIANGVEVPAPVTPAARREARRDIGVEAPVVLFLGRFDREKSPETLLAAWPRVRAARATLLVVGDGPLRPEVEGLASSLGELSRPIRLCGPTADPSLYLRAADVVVVPSASEGMSNVLLEAMAHGLPVVATDIAGNREVLVHPELGALVAPGDPAALARAVDRWLEDPAAAAKAGGSARTHVAERYGVDRMVSAYERLFVALADSR